MRLALEVLVATVALPMSLGVAADGKSFLVGSNEGLYAYTLDGSHRLVSRGRARHPRWWKADAVLVADNDLQGGAGANILVVSLPHGDRQTIAAIPPFSCGGDDSLNVSLWTGSDFLVDRKRGQVCIDLMDRNLNMAGIIVNVMIDAASGRVTRRLMMGEEGCTPPPDVRVGESPSKPPCSANQAQRTRVKPLGPFRFKRGVIRRGAERIATHRALTHFTATEISPTGRWFLLESEPAEGDFIYRNLLLFDASTGAVHVVPTSPQWTPPPAVGWLDLGPSDALLVKDLVIIPGERAFRVEGDVVR
jgi:hypothetical protein